VLERAARAEPTQGELFAPENKRVGARRSVAEVVRAIAAGLGPSFALASGDAEA
jgi:hypothetical protein